ncbi:MFS general substrate transporter [Exidia glandulosa HHB12029]|uniref:MFS general substrate transporter n=1 Tax=Exidia glandulosa HHB12029 TaxID=1314781 RepID=A0A165B3W2_EXIGL|nr:MFS general substrate transporter [Exidia glandulosa HHB12029]
MRTATVEATSTNVKLDRCVADPILSYGGESAERGGSHGLPLVPQPTERTDDPLNWPRWLKYIVLAQVSVMALLGQFSSAAVNPAFVDLAREFQITTVQASYQTTVASVCTCLQSLMWIPLANVYGRRPVYLLSTLMTGLTALGSARAPSYGALVATRVLNGIGYSAPIALGAGVVVDIFLLHERGRAMGIFAVFLSNGAHLSPIPCGFIAETVGWRWCFYLAAILHGVMFCIMLVALPETLFFRDSKAMSHESPRHSIRSRLALWGFRTPGRSLHWREIYRPFQMAIYPSVILCAIYYSVLNGYASIEFSVTVAATFSQLYGFNAGHLGLSLGLSLLIGSLLGELASGPIMDTIMRRARKRSPTDNIVPEVRLNAIWTGAILVPAGILIYGLTVHFRAPVAVPCAGMAIGSFGLQVIASVTYTYCSDCYKPQTSEVSSLFNVMRQLFGCTLAFYSIPFGNKVGYQWSFTCFAVICIVFFLPIVWLMRRGQAVRERLGKPSFNTSL